MTGSGPGEETTTRGAGDRRQEDRREGDRRREDRRSPPPPWRRPWAFVGYGVLGSLLIVAVLRAIDGDDPSAPLEITSTTAPPGVVSEPAPAADAPIRAAYSIGDFEELLARGGAAAGQRVRTLLFCEPTGTVALHEVRRVPEAVADLADAQRRVPAAECKWGGETGAPDFLLLVPAHLAAGFAALPEVEQGFVRRRRVPAEVEWLGRSEALALRTSGVLRALGR